MKIAVTGYKGRLGSELVRLGCMPLMRDSDEEELDITDKEQLKDVLDSLKPEVVINCAAFTDVDACISPKTFESATQVNMRGVESLLDAFPGRIIHISTDYVFDGNRGPYDENRGYNHPVNDYGWTKWGAEVLFLTPCRPGNLLVRTTGLYGGSSNRHDFSTLVINTLSKGDPLGVSKELRGNQTYVPHLASALIFLANHPLKISSYPILHVASKEVISRYEFALMIASYFKLDKNLINPVLNSQVPGWVAKRPTKAGLKVKLAERLGVPIYSIKQGLEALHGQA